MADSRMTGTRPEGGVANRSGYAPREDDAKPTLASGFNNFWSAGRLTQALRFGMRYGVDREFLPRYLGILMMDAAFAPWRFRQSVTYGGRIRRAELDPEPLYILGVPRSGTTLLHNLISRDPRWAFVTTYQTAMPDSFLATPGWLKRRIEASLPATRGVDNMELRLDLPMEEEVGMMCASGISPYVFLFFPRTGQDMQKYLFMGDDLTRQEWERWRREYTLLLKAASYYMDGRPLLLKCPANTGRVAALLKLFPRARFIYIQRNPYDTLRSYIRLIRLMDNWHALQDVDFDDLLRRQMHIYRRMTDSYQEQRKLIPEGRLVEVKYEELEVDMVGQVRMIYEALGLDGYDAFAPRLTEYVDSLAGFQKNPTYVSDQVIELINEHVPFLVSQYGYEFRSPAAAQAQPQPQPA